ncbi:phosphatase [Irregularibacter muris]|uniref:Phosphatase n=1 Tax=Irregularibacter muris TaxID=1796619 RepID=A0AAE3HFC7_9FIRM|nr:phosphatase [Irregularibacter muris]MCR1899096.1 phosphatase [Irregularibacter muris]
MKLLMDMHNHTMASGHAYSTIQEIALEASKKGLTHIAITDHGPKTPGGPPLSYIRNLKVMPKELYGVKILRGVEANILDQGGNLDVPESILETLDIVIAGLHEACTEPWNMEGNTRALLNTMENEHVDIISHPGNPIFPIDKKKFVMGAKKTNTLVEINNSSFINSRKGSEKNCYEIAMLCKKHRVPIIINSDSHISFDVGKFDEAIKLVKDIEMQEDLIINTCIDGFENYLGGKRSTIARQM